jgi:hypothetical protein
MTPARDFVSDLETARREEQLEEQLRQEKHQAELDRQESNRREAEHRQQLEEASQRPAGKTTPPPIPDINPWAPQKKESSEGHSSQTNAVTKGLLTLGGKMPGDRFLLPAGYFFCAITLISGHQLREGAALAALGFGIALLLRKRITTGIIMIAVAVGAYGFGLLLTDLIHDYMTKNYPH